jgi:hypothetical protein
VEVVCHDSRGHIRFAGLWQLSGSPQPTITKSQAMPGRFRLPLPDVPAHLLKLH